MPPIWKNLGVQARFVAIAAVGILALAAVTMALIAWFEFASLEDRWRGLSKNELGSLNALVETAMQQRVEDPQNVAIRVFNGWFDSRNKSMRENCEASGARRSQPTWRRRIRTAPPSRRSTKSTRRR